MAVVVALLECKKYKFMKDIKTILIIVLLGATLFFGYMWFFKGDNGYKEKIKQLEAEKKELVKERENLDNDVRSILAEFNSLKEKEKKLLADVAKLDAEIAKSKANAAKSKAELDKMKKDLKDTQDKIAYLKDHPVNRTGDDLLNSLKMKTQK